MSKEELGVLLLQSIQDGIPSSDIIPIIAAGASANFCQPTNRLTALHLACQFGRNDIVALLIDQGADVNLRGVDMSSALHVAALRKHQDCVVILLDAGAEVNARNIDGSTPLCEAAAAGSLECLTLLVKHGADINPKILQTPPLHEACLSGSEACIKFLIDAGANINATDSHFGSPLHAACYQGLATSVRVLLESGAEPNSSRLFKRPLHIACAGGHLDCIQLLALHGANPYHEDWRGTNAFQYCKNRECLGFLEVFYSQPRSLLELCWLCIRNFLGSAVIKGTEEFNVPVSLQYLLRYGPSR